MSSTGKIRIIAGKWRSRKITFPSIPGLRPTQDRIRETLFNWLNDYIEGARCLDLFAGSGALGFEALSRGASHVTFVDNSPRIISALRKNVDLLGAGTMVDVIQSDCPDPVITFQSAPFDIVFLDPPFFQGLLESSGGWLEKGRHLKKHALIYVEAEVNLSPLPLPSVWTVKKEKKTSSLSYTLLERGGEK